NGVTAKSLEYLPLSLRYDANWRDSWGNTSIGLGLSFNAWYSGTVQNLDRVTGSLDSSGHWLIFTPSMSRDIFIHTNWTLSLKFDAQVASEPLVSTEQYGAGGVNSVRGYHEGEVFGDDGWRASIEQKTPGFLVGFVGRNLPVTFRGSIFMDYA